MVPQLLCKTTHPISFKPWIYTQGVYLTTPIYFLPRQPIFGPLVVKKQSEIAVFQGFRNFYAKLLAQSFTNLVYTLKLGASRPLFIFYPVSQFLAL